jgi:hypothetical protein
MRKIRPTVKNTSSVIHTLNITAQLNISIWNYCALQEQSHFQTIYTEETQKLWHKNYQLCDSKRYRPTYNMTVYAGTDRKCTTSAMTATDATVTGLTAKTENVGHKLYMDNSSPELFHDFTYWDNNCCGTVRPNRKMIATVLDRKWNWSRVTQNIG